MSEKFIEPDPESQNENTNNEPLGVRSLKELISLVSGRNIYEDRPEEDAGIADTIPFPFLGLVGQKEMKLALILALINPAIGGVLLIGPRGTGKTTAVRSLQDLLPEVKRSVCFYGCTEEDVLSGGMDGVCPDCARKFSEGNPLTKPDLMRTVELPLNSELNDVIGYMEEGNIQIQRMKLKRGILAQSDQNILFIDEVNMLRHDVANVILDAASNGSYFVKRGPLSAIYRSRMTLIGAMNPEEGELRPQFLDRFGIRVPVHGLNDPKDRIQVYRRVQMFREKPAGFATLHEGDTKRAREEIKAARELLPCVHIPEEIALMGSRLILSLKIDSLRAEMALFEAARAHAAGESRIKVDETDLDAVAPMVLRFRHSPFMDKYFNQTDHELEEINNIYQEIKLDKKE